MTIQDNKELVRRYNEEIWNNHNLEKADEFMDAEFLKETIEHVRQFLTAFPDVHVTIEDLIAEGDKVVARLVATATNSGPFAGQSATGKRVEIRSIRIYHIVNNKFVDTWAMQDRMGLMEQLGLLRSPGSDVNWAAGHEDE